MDLESFFSGPALNIAYILIIVGAILAIIVPIVIAVISDPKSLIKSLIGLVVLGVVFFIGYSMSGNEVTEKYITYEVTTPGLSQMIGGMLSMMYILGIVAVIGVVLGFFTKLVQ